MAELSAQPRPARTRDVPGGSRKSARGSQRKEEAQQATAAGLDLLRVLGWLVLHDVDLPGDEAPEVDHVLAGPSGVYVVDTVSWAGAIHADGDVLTVGKTDHSDALVEIAAAADVVRALLGGTPVAPLLCFERLEAVVAVAGDVALCASENILDLLTTQPQILDPAAVARASRSLSAALRPGGGAPVVRVVADESPKPAPEPVAETGPAPAPAGPTLEELVRARSAEQARAAESEVRPVEPEAQAAVAPEASPVALAPEASPVATPSTQSEESQSEPQPEPEPEHGRRGIVRALRRPRRGSKVSDPALVEVAAAADAAVQPIVQPTEEPVEEPVEVDAETTVEAMPTPVVAGDEVVAPELPDAEEAPVVRLPNAAVAEAGAALWRSLTEPDEAVEDVEAAVAEAEARQREAEEREAEQRRVAVEARELVQREAEEMAAEVRAVEEAHEARARAAREALEQAQREAVEAEARELAERAEQERLEAERLEREAREQAEREEAERLEAERLEAARLEAERLEREAREQAEREEAERLEREAREQAERLEAERLEAERLEAERLEREAREQAEREEAERLEREAREQAERLEREAREQAEREEAERLEAERLEAERLEAERLEREAREQAERLEAARLEAARLEAERLEREAREQAEREEAERLEAERLEAERLEAERLEAARLEAERLEREAREQAEREEAERLEAERLEREAREQAEREEAERLEAERLEAERLEAARLEAERLEREAREQAEREEAARLEAERLEREAREQAEREEAERLEQEAREQAEREEAERLERKREKAERKAERKARAKAEREARELAAREEKERLVAEEARARAAWEARLAAAREREAREAAALDAELDAGDAAIVDRHPEVRRGEVLVLGEPVESSDSSEVGATGELVADAAVSAPADEVDLDTWEPAADESWQPEVLEAEETWAPEPVAPRRWEPRAPLAVVEEAEPGTVPEDVPSTVIVQAARRRRLRALARRTRREGHGIPGRAFLHVAVAALLIAGVIVGGPRLGGAVAWGRQIFAGPAPATVGTLVKVDSSTLHPAAEVLAGTPVDAQVTDGTGAGKGKHLVAVPFRIHNGGTSPWAVPIAATAVVKDNLGVSHPVARGVKAIKGYPLVPAKPTVAPGQDLTGYAVFAVPNGRTVGSISLGLARSGGDPVTWQVAP